MTLIEYLEEEIKTLKVERFGLVEAYNSILERGVYKTSVHDTLERSLSSYDWRLEYPYRVIQCLDRTIEARKYLSTISQLDEKIIKLQEQIIDELKKLNPKSK